MTDLEKKLDQLIDVLQRPSIPLDVALWSAAEVAAYLCVSVAQVRERYACRPDFPRPIRLPVTGSSGQGHPRWKASEVIEWAENYQEKRRAA
jgi:predicted DNA-binding transcriptional regulator AlpA